MNSKYQLVTCGNCDQCKRNTKIKGIVYNKSNCLFENCNKNSLHLHFICCNKCYENSEKQIKNQKVTK